MTENTITNDVTYLVENLASSWNGGSEVLDRLVQAAGGGHASPYAAIRELGNEGIERLFREGAAREELAAAAQALREYLATETWFGRAARHDERLATFREHPIAYFCAEFALADWLPIYSGGLGVLAGDVLKEASDLGLPFVGIGLFYRRGFFYQQLDQNEYQTEVQPTLRPEDLPLIRTQDAAGRDVTVEVPMGDRTVSVAVWQLQVGRTTLYLLDTDTPENESAYDRSITSTLYGGNQETRIRQEIVLGIGGVRVLRALNIDPSIYGMNEGHAAFLGLELLGEHLEGHNPDAAVELVRQRVVYTNHTVVPAGNDIFPADLVRAYLGRYATDRDIGEERLLQLAATDTPGHFSMPILAFHLAGKANAVSQIHAHAIAREWPGFQVEVVTNGVHVPTWLGKEVRALLDRYVPGWREDSPSWAQVLAIPASELWNARVEQRRRMLEFVASRVPDTKLNPDALTIAWARRFAEYKRADLLVSDLARLQRIMSDADRPVQVVISGKAHPMDEGGKHIMQRLIHSLQDNPALAPHIAFVQDYSLGIAQELTAGADVWLNTPRKPLEASGTSGMKSSDNGGLQLTVRDGWAAEVDWWDVGWGIDGNDDAADAEQMYHFLEDSIQPCFYTRDDSGVPAKWVSMVKNSMHVSLSRYSARRMVLEYLYKLYLPLLEQQGVDTLVPTA